MTDTLPAWAPINTAPKEWIREPTFDLDGRQITIRNGCAIKVRGMDGSGMETEDIVCWAQQDGFVYGREPHWWDLVHETPLFYGPSHWRPLTPPEEAQLDQLAAAEAPGAEASTPSASPEHPDAAEARRQAFSWAWRANGGSLASWAERWGRIMWLSGMPEGAETAGFLSADMGDGWTLNLNLALDWELNRPSYTRLAAALPAWLRDLPADIAAEAQAIPGPADGHIPDFWHGPHTQQLVQAASALFKLALDQAEQLPYPGPWTMMLSSIIQEQGICPWDDDEGPRATHLDPDWTFRLARDVDTMARDKQAARDCTRSLAKVMALSQVAAIRHATPFLRATVAAGAAVTLIRRAVTEEEAALRLEAMLATVHACDLQFWNDHGGWPWKPIQINPRAMFLAAERVAAQTGISAAVAGRA